MKVSFEATVIVVPMGVIRIADAETLCNPNEKNVTASNNTKPVITFNFILIPPYYYVLLMYI